mgnify:FL=1
MSMQAVVSDCGNCLRAHERNCGAKNSNYGQSDGKITEVKQSRFITSQFVCFANKNYVFSNEKLISDNFLPQPVVGCS